MVGLQKLSQGWENSLAVILAQGIDPTGLEHPLGYCSLVVGKH
jgi:hypothetical protein